jgi:hypothetical protein
MRAEVINLQPRYVMIKRTFIPQLSNLKSIVRINYVHEAFATQRFGENLRSLYYRLFIISDTFQAAGF